MIEFSALYDWIFSAPGGNFQSVLDIDKIQKYALSERNIGFVLLKLWLYTVLYVKKLEIQIHKYTLKNGCYEKMEKIAAFLQNGKFLYN